MPLSQKEPAGGVADQENITPSPPKYAIESGIPVRPLYGAKTMTVKIILAEVGETGITPKELTDELTKRSLKVSSSFASNTLFRMKKNGEVIIRDDGRYVLVKEKQGGYEQPREAA